MLGSPEIFLRAQPCVLVIGSTHSCKGALVFFPSIPESPLNTSIRNSNWKVVGSTPSCKGALGVFPEDSESPLNTRIRTSNRKVVGSTSAKEHSDYFPSNPESPLTKYHLSMSSDGVNNFQLSHSFQRNLFQ